jgi:hypothetical protein
MEQTEEYNSVEKAKLMLTQILKKHRSVDVNNIIDLIEKYLTDKCNHNVIEDLIDIDPDRSKMIKYCDKCYKTF